MVESINANINRLEENSVVTTCKLTTADPDYLEDIPIAHDSLSLKIIMKVKLRLLGERNKHVLKLRGIGELAT